MENKWHDASACLPVEGTGSVLVIVSGMHNNVNYLYTTMIAEYVKGDGWIIDGREDWENANVLCWTPLPALPEMVQSRIEKLLKKAGCSA